MTIVKITKFNRRYELSDEAMLILHEDGAATLEVLYGEDLAMVALSPSEMEQLRKVLEKESNISPSAG